MFGSAVRSAIKKTLDAINREDVDQLRGLPVELQTIAKRASVQQAEQMVELIAVATDIIATGDSEADIEWLNVASAYLDRCVSSYPAQTAILHVAANTASACVESGDYRGAERPWDVAGFGTRHFPDEPTAEYLCQIAANCAIAAAVIQDETWMKDALSNVIKIAHQFPGNAFILSNLVDTISSVDEDQDALQLMAKPDHWSHLEVDKIPLFSSNDRCAHLFTIGAYFAINGSKERDTVVFWARQTEKGFKLWGHDVEIQGRWANAAAQAVAVCQITDLSNYWPTTLLAIAKRYPTVPQIQSLVGLAGLSACGAIVDGEHDRSKRELLFQPWIDRMAAALPPSGLSDVAIDSLVKFVLQRVFSEQSQEFVRLCFAIHEYWPGLRCVHPNRDDFINFGDLIASSVVVERADLKELMTATRELIHERIAVEKLASEFDPRDLQVFVEVWDKRMFLPDRGDGLMPILKSMGIDKQYEEGENDPWRLAERWHPPRENEAQ